MRRRTILLNRGSRQRRHGYDVVVLPRRSWSQLEPPTAPSSAELWGPGSVRCTVSKTVRRLKKKPYRPHAMAQPGPFGAHCAKVYWPGWQLEAAEPEERQWRAGKDRAIYPA